MYILKLVYCFLNKIFKAVQELHVIIVFPSTLSYHFGVQKQSLEVNNYSQIFPFIFVGLVKLILLNSQFWYSTKKT